MVVVEDVLDEDVLGEVVLGEVVLEEVVLEDVVLDEVVLDEVVRDEAVVADVGQTLGVCMHEQKVSINGAALDKHEDHAACLGSLGLSQGRPQPPKASLVSRTAVVIMAVS